MYCYLSLPSWPKKRIYTDDKTNTRYIQRNHIGYFIRSDSFILHSGHRRRNGGHQHIGLSFSFRLGGHVADVVVPPYRHAYLMVRTMAHRAAVGVLYRHAIATLECYHYLSSGIATALVFTDPIWCAIIGLVVFGDKFSWKLTTSILLATIGVMMMTGVFSEDGTFSWPGGALGAGVGSFVCDIHYFGATSESEKYSEPETHVLCLFYRNDSADTLCVGGARACGADNESFLPHQPDAAGSYPDGTEQYLRYDVAQVDKQHHCGYFRGV